MLLPAFIQRLEREIVGPDSNTNDALPVWRDVSPLGHFLELLKNQPGFPWFAGQRVGVAESGDSGGIVTRAGTSVLKLDNGLVYQACLFIRKA
jgi:hypothetical protein